MTQEHPVIPPQELLSKWRKRHWFDVSDLTKLLIEAAQWGADQELDACCEWMRQSCQDGFTADLLRSARRPKPPSLKEQALEVVDRIEKARFPWATSELDTIRRALETLPS